MWFEDDRDDIAAVRCDTADPSCWIACVPPGYEIFLLALFLKCRLSASSVPGIVGQLLWSGSKVDLNSELKVQSVDEDVNGQVMGKTCAQNKSAVYEHICGGVTLVAQSYARWFEGPKLEKEHHELDAELHP